MTTPQHPRLRRGLGATASAGLVAALAALTLLGPASPVDAPGTIRPRSVPAPLQDTVLTCAAAPGNALGATDVATASSTTTLVLADGATGTVTDPGGTAGTPLAAGRATTLPTGAGAVVTASPGSSGEPAQASGSTTTVSAAGDLRGLSVSACTAPTTSAWLVAGSAAAGSSAELRLTNPGTTTVTATTTLYGSTGTLTLPAGGEVSVAPGTTQSVYLEASGTQDGRLAVHVLTSGGPLGVSLVDESLDGETPAGVDVVTPGADPATEQVVPGVVLTDAAHQGGGHDGLTSSDPTLVRLVNPGDQPATVGLSLLGEAGEEALPGATSVVVDPGAVFDVSLAGTTPGTYTLRATSDVPVGAAVQLVRSDGEHPARSGSLAHDRTWLQATTVDPADGAVLPLPGGAGLSRAVVLAGAGDQDVTVTLTDPGSRWSTQVLLAPGTTRAVEGVPADATTLLVTADREGARAGAVVTTAVDGAVPGTLISSLPLVADAQASASRRVVLR